MPAGLYIYAGEDLPESEAPEDKPVPAPKCDDCGGMLFPVKKRNGEMWSVNDMAEYSRRRFDRCLCADAYEVAAQPFHVSEKPSYKNSPEKCVSIPTENNPDVSSTEFLSVTSLIR